MNEDEKHFRERITRALDEDVARLDGATRSRLTQARARALASAARPVRWWIPASGAVLASLIAAFIVYERPVHVPAGPHLQPQDLEMLSTRGGLELYRNLDFYLWLEKEKGRAG